MTPIELIVKQYIREFFTARMNEVKHQAMPFRQIPAIVIREEEMEKFIDNLWLEINQRLLEHNHEGS